MDRLTIYLLTFLCIALTSCSKSNDGEPGDNPNPTNRNTNAWVYKKMQENYYWKSYMPAESATKPDLAPEAYFKSLLYARDRFSSIDPESSTRGDEKNGMAFDFGLYFMRWTYQGSPRNTLQVLYVIPGSPAEKAGIKRADLFSHYDGILLDTLNYKTMLGLSSVVLTQCTQREEKIRDISLSKANFYDTPVIRDTVYEFQDKNIGYIFYSKFYSARHDTDDIDLKNVLRKMKEKNVRELILDLRFNGGGYLTISTDLASRLVTKPFVRDDAYLWIEYTPLNGKERISKIPFTLEGNSENLNLDHLHIIANGSSASSSEVTIHGLHPYMQNTLTQYGERTYGKNVGSHPISGKDDNIPWELNAITSRLYDKDGKAGDNWTTFVGLNPDYKFDELGIQGGAAYYMYRGQLGEFEPDKDYDAMLNFVMAKMGRTTLVERQNHSRATEGLPAIKPEYLPVNPQLIITE